MPLSLTQANILLLHTVHMTYVIINIQTRSVVFPHLIEASVSVVVVFAVLLRRLRVCLQHNVLICVVDMTLWVCC